MRRLVVPLLSCVVLSCGASPVAPATAPTSAVVLPPPVEAARKLEINPRNTGNLPVRTAGLATLDPDKLSQLAANLARLMQPAQADLVERVLALPSGTLASGHLAASLGVDPSRPVLVAVASLDKPGQSIVDSTRKKLDQRVGYIPGISRATEKSLNASRHPPTHIRVVVPANDQPKLLSRLHALLENRRYGKVSAPAELESLYARRERVVALSLGPGLVQVDIFAFTGTLPTAKSMGEAALSTLRTLQEGGNATPLPLEGHLLRISYSPSQAADLGFVEALARLQDSLGGGGESSLDYRLSMAVRERAQIFDLAGNKQGPYFDRLNLTLDLESGLPSLSSQARLSSAMPVSPTGCVPKVSVDFPGALARFDISTACLTALPVPGDPPGNAFQRTNFDSLVEAAGWVGWPVALPFSVLAAARIPFHWWEGVGPQAMLRFERFGWANPAYGAPDVFWGLMPPGAKPGEVACSIADDPRRCTGKWRIKPEGITERAGQLFARVVRLGDRVIVLSSRDRSALQALSPTLTPSPVPALRGAVSQGTMRRLFSELGLHAPSFVYTGSAQLEGGQLTVTVRPSPQP